MYKEVAFVITFSDHDHRVSDQTCILIYFNIFIRMQLNKNGFILIIKG